MNSASALIATLLGAPLAGLFVLAWLGHHRLAPMINLACSAISFAAAIALAPGVLEAGDLFAAGEVFHLDALSMLLVVLVTLIGATTALHSIEYRRFESANPAMAPLQWRIYHALYQAISLALLLALIANNLGIIWVALEGATLATVLVVSLERTRAAMEAAWKYFVLCGVGILQALFGTVLLYMAAERVIGAEGSALLWTHLAAIRTQLDPGIVTLALAFLFTGYGTKMGLAPLHGWMPDAHAEGPPPVTCVLSGLLLTVVLHTVLRCKVIADGALGEPLAGHLMVGFGLLSMVLAALVLARQTRFRRLLAWSSIEHMGLMSIAFGLGGALATLAGLLHLIGHALIKSMLYFGATHAMQWRGSDRHEALRGLLGVHPLLAWSLALGLLAILGLPPFALFPGEYLLTSVALRKAPWLGIVLLIALGWAFAAMALRLRDLVFGTADPVPAEIAARATPGPLTWLPFLIHLGLALALGLWMPAPLEVWLRWAAAIITG
jgi:hydrogenase-4 component F